MWNLILTTLLKISPISLTSLLQGLLERRYGCNRAGLLDMPIDYTLLTVEETKLESDSVAIKDEIEK